MVVRGKGMMMKERRKLEKIKAIAAHVLRYTHFKNPEAFSVSTAPLDSL